MTCSCCENCILTHRQKRWKPMNSPRLEPSMNGKCITFKQVYCKRINDDKHELLEKRFHNHRETRHSFKKSYVFYKCTLHRHDSIYNGLHDEDYLFIQILKYL